MYLKALVNDHVFWLDITVTYTPRIEVALDLRQLLEDVLCVFQRHWSVLRKVPE